MSLAEMPPSILAEPTRVNDVSRPRWMTLEEMLALPEADVERDLIEGQLVERPITKRNRSHSGVEARITQLLGDWLESRRELRESIDSGEAGFRPRRDPDTIVGIDVAYVSAEVIAATSETAPYLENPPILAVEILSPSDQHGEMLQKIRAYLEAGVGLVWLVDPDFKTIIVYRPEAAPVMFNVEHEIAGEPNLPGFRVALSRIFS